MPPKNLLIADDDKTFSHLLAAEMRALGWRVTIASDAMQAIMFAVRSPQDVIILDVQMPGGTGLVALRKLKASSKTQATPVVVVSVSTDPEVEAKMLEMGAARFLRKPVAIDVLHRELQALCGAPTDTRIEQTGQEKAGAKEEDHSREDDDSERFH